MYAHTRYVDKCFIPARTLIVKHVCIHVVFVCTFPVGSPLAVSIFLGIVLIAFLSLAMVLSITPACYRNIKASCKGTRKHANAGTATMSCTHDMQIPHPCPTHTHVCMYVHMYIVCVYGIMVVCTLFLLLIWNSLCMTYILNSCMYVCTYVRTCIN